MMINRCVTHLAIAVLTFGLVPTCLLGHWDMKLKQDFSSLSIINLLSFGGSSFNSLRFFLFI